MKKTSLNVLRAACCVRHGKAAPVRREAYGVKRAAESGVAIIVTLIILAMLTILLVAFVSNVSVERQASSAFSNQMRARLAAQAAVEQAIFQISQGTDPTNQYISCATNFYVGSVINPMTYFYARGITNFGFTTNYLSSTSLGDSNNFNDRGYVFPTSLISNLQVPWVYLANGSFTNTSAQANAVSNKALTRIAWWIDDESSKFNVNYNGNLNGAGSTFVRTNTFDVSSINFVGLSNLVMSVDDAAIVNNRAPVPYETLPTLMEAGGNLTNIFQNGWGAFATVYNPDYEVQTNGTSRININDDATNTAVAGVAVTNIHNAITNAYPNYAGKYSGGYYNSGDKALYQIAANIRDYIDPSNIPTDENPNDYSGTNAYFGRKKVPYLNEVAFKTFVTNYSLPAVGTTTNILTVSNVYSVELMNLYNSPFTAATKLQFDYPVVSYSGNGGVLSSPPAGSLPLAGRANLGCTMTVPAFGPGVGYGLAVTNYFLGAGTVTNFYSTLPTSYSIVIQALSSTATMVSTNLYSLNLGGQRLDYALVPLVPPQTLLPSPGVVGSVSIGASATVESPVSAIDPRLNHLTNDWVWFPTDTLGSVNPTWRPDLLGDQNNITALQGEGGFPFTSTNLLTVGELGNIAVPGIAGTAAGNTNSITTSPYFRTLKMYGDGYANAGADPDWELLDLFTVSNGSQKIQGKVNINTQRDFIYNGNYGALQGLLQGVTNNNFYVNSTMAQQMATDIMLHVPYYHIGQLGNKAATLSSQTGQLTGTDYDKEAVIRALSNIITIRGNVFTIYGKGQSVSIVHGSTNVLGEAYIQSVVERIPQTNSFGAVTGQTFKVKYHRFLSE